MKTSLETPRIRLAGFHSFCIRRERQPGFGPVVQVKPPAPDFNQLYEAQRAGLARLNS